MALTDMNMWDPNARLGDLQLMAMDSRMNHEELRETKVKGLMIREKNEKYPVMVYSKSYCPYCGQVTPPIEVVGWRRGWYIYICRRKNAAASLITTWAPGSTRH